MTYDVHALQTIARAAQDPGLGDNAPEVPGTPPGPIQKPPRYLPRMYSPCDRGWHDLAGEPNGPAHAHGAAVTVSHREPAPQKPEKEAPGHPTTTRIRSGRCTQSSSKYGRNSMESVKKYGTWIQNPSIKRCPETSKKTTKPY